MRMELFSDVLRLIHEDDRKMFYEALSQFLNDKNDRQWQDLTELSENSPTSIGGEMNRIFC